MTAQPAPDAGAAEGDCPLEPLGGLIECDQAGALCRYPNLSNPLQCREGKWEHTQPGADAACPEQPPMPGSPCPAGQRCSYMAEAPACNAAQAFETECDGTTGGWHYWHALTCGDFAPACDATGTWSVTYTFDEPAVSCAGDTAVQLQLRRAASGELLVLDWDGSTTVDGCSLSLRRQVEWTSPSEYGSFSYDIQLQLEGDSASGTGSLSASGFCQGRAEGTLSATRQP